MSKNKRAARAARFLVEFFDVAKWRREIFSIWSSDNKASQQQ